MLYDIITNAMVVVIIVIMLATIYDNIKCDKEKRWLDYLVIGLGVVWTAFYIFVLVSEPKNSAVIGQVFVRPLNVVTFFVFYLLNKIRLVGKSCRQ
jgi:uncharacterized membrane protein